MKVPTVLSSSVRVAITIVFVGLLLYFTLRSDSNFGSVAWMPTGVTRFVQKNLHLRNFWGFLPFGVFLGCAYRILPRAISWQRPLMWRLLFLFSLPIWKEIVQIPLANRHCNWPGMAAGVGGLLVGLMLGLGIKWVLIFYRTKMKPSLPLQIS